MPPRAAIVTASPALRRSVPLGGKGMVTFAAAVALVAMVTGGCSSSHSDSRPAARPLDRAGSDGVQRVSIATTDQFRFTPAEVTVKTGRIALTLTGTGSYPHNISVPDLHETSASVSGSPGQSSTTLMLTITTPGRYAFVCTYHSSAGMKGDLVVLQGS